MPADISYHTPQYAVSNRRPSKNDSRPHPPSSTSPNLVLYPADEPLLQKTNMGRTSSRRSKGGGQDDKGDLGFFDLIPAAPDVPRGSRGGPPISYRDPYLNGDLVPEAEPSSRSFAARTGIVPNEVDTDLANPIATNRMPLIEPRRQSVRNGVDQGQRANNAQTEQPLTPLLSNPGQTPIRASSLKQSTREYRPIREVVNTKIPRSDNPTTSPLVRSTTSRTSTGSQGDWAADRSPLQRLEVKLSDISKEEKRARVQEAEQRLRDSQALASARVPSQSTHSKLPRGSPKQTASSQGATSYDKKAYADRNRTSQLSSKATPEHSSHSTENIGTETDSHRDRNPFIASSQQSVGRPPPGMRSQPAPKSRNQYPQKSGNDKAHNDDRGVRFETDLRDTPLPGNSPQSESKAKDRQLNRPLEQKPIKGHDITSSKLGSGAVDEHIANHLGTIDPVPSHAVRSHNHALKYEVPPQTAAGIDTRQRIGFGSRVDGITNVPARHRHHLSDILHRSRHDKQPTGDFESASPRHLDEWREGGTARLTLADSVTETRSPEQASRKAWWEEPKSARKGRIESNEVGFMPSNESYEDNNGTQNFPLHKRKSSIANARETIDPVRARQYIGYEGTVRVRRRNRIFQHEHESIMGSYTQSGLQRTPSSFYSYTCPHLSHHDPLHQSHICQPYLSKGLIRSMRGVRVRFPADPTAFNPPLLLKCGPLLRYTGLRRDKVEQPSGRGLTTIERETWRGSIMMVTTDAQSQYAPVPTLRLFHQPMKLLSPPSQQIDGTSENELPLEYVDPIAGLPRLTRSGGTVYVKPVEDLEEGKDVSKIENDDGLYEETRTANVPTSYGKADELLGRNPLPSLSRNKSSQQERQRSGQSREVRGIRLHTERGVTFWRFNLEVELGDKQARIAYRINRGASVGFWVPARGQTMNIMFHSCNGFSMSVE